MKSRDIPVVSAVFEAGADDWVFDSLVLLGPPYRAGRCSDSVPLDRGACGRIPLCVRYIRSVSGYSMKLKTTLRALVPENQSL